MPVRFYKGVGVGTHHHHTDLRTTGLMPRTAGTLDEIAVQDHIAHGTAYSPCISLTRSFGVARDYAMNSALAPPTRAQPAYVYELHVPEDTKVPLFIDPVHFIAARNADPLSSRPYQHDGDQKFLGVVAYPLSSGGTYPLAPQPPGLAGATHVSLSATLKTIVNAIRDAEVLVHGNIPPDWIKRRYDIF